MDLMANVLMDMVANVLMDMVANVLMDLVANVLMDMVANVLMDLVANVLMYWVADFAHGACVQEPSVGFAKPTFQQDCVESSCSQCVEEIGAVGRFRHIRVTEKTRCGQQKQSCENCEMKPKDSTVKVKSQQRSLRSQVRIHRLVSLHLSFTVHVASGFVVEYILFGDKAPALVVEYITFAPMKFVEAVFHEIDEELCHDEIRIYAMWCV